MLSSRLVPVICAAAALAVAAPAEPAAARERTPTAQAAGMRKLPRARAEAYLDGLARATVRVRVRG